MRSRWGILAGVLVALGLPIVYWVIGLALERGLMTDGQARPIADVLASTVLVELLLGPIGIVIAARSAGIQGTARWVVLLATAGPALAIVWLLGLLTMFGALGSPL